MLEPPWCSPVPLGQRAPPSSENPRRLLELLREPLRRGKTRGRWAWLESSRRVSVPVGGPALRPLLSLLGVLVLETLTN